MAELSPSERLQPSLLDRLTDDEPQSRVESRDRRVLSTDKLRESVRRDLSWLFNTPNLATVQSLSEYPEVERSTLNYGIPDMAGHTSSGVDKAEVLQLLRRAILEFEPRLVSNSVNVDLVIDQEQMSINAVCFGIRAELWAQPLPVRLYLKTNIDLEDGEVRLTEVTKG